MQNVIGIDLGGTKITGAVVTQDGQTLEHTTVPTDVDQGRDAVIERITTIIAQLTKQHSIAAVGLGTPGYVDVGQGRVMFASDNIPGWSGAELGQALKRVFSGPVVVENDANCAAMGEAWLGAGRDCESFLMLTLGTGVGGALFHRQIGIWHGQHWRGGEVGHTILYPGGLPCNCGQVGCVDQYLSGTALRHAYQRSTGQSLEAREIFAQAQSGEAASQRIVDQFASDMAVLLTSLKNTLDPQAFIIGGGLIYAKSVWWDKVLAQFASQCIHAEDTLILPAQCENEAGYLGAAKLALEAVGN
jgi:glucokinase